MTFEKKTYVHRATIEAFCGVGLAVHQVFNLLGPSTNMFCRLCLYNRADLHTTSLEKKSERTEEVFHQQVALSCKQQFFEQKHD